MSMQEKRNLLLGRILVPALAGLAAVLALDDLIHNAEAGHIVGVAALGETVAADIVVHVQAGHVHQLEGAHGIAQTLLTGGVDILDAGDTLLQQVAGLAGHSGVDAVSNEAGDLLVDGDGGLVGVQAESLSGLNSLIVGVGVADQLDQLHDQSGVEVVHVQQALGVHDHVGQLGAADVGAVGARLYYGDKSIQHAGIAYGICGLAANLMPGVPYGSHGYFGRECLTQNLSAVTGACLFSKRSIYEEVGYMEEELFKVAFNDVDFCLKIREKGYLIVYNPYIELMHYESKTRGYENTPEKQERFERECNNFKTKWKDLLSKPDPYLNINFSRNTALYNVRTDKVEY